LTCGNTHGKPDLQVQVPAATGQSPLQMAIFEKKVILTSFKSALKLVLSTEK
jgi:hypothetical protein